MECVAMTFVSHRHVMIGLKNVIVIAIPFPSKPWFFPVCNRSLFEISLGKGIIACY